MIDFKEVVCFKLIESADSLGLAAVLIVARALLFNRIYWSSESKPERYRRSERYPSCDGF